MGKPDLGALIAQTMAPPPERRTIEAITGEILEAKRAGGEAILTIGRCLMEAKGMLRHGEWLPWLNERVELSERTAQKFMKLAREWSNPNTLADLGASKALMLLALPEGERDAFLEDHNVIDMSARQLEAAIKERDEARAAAEQAQADKQHAEQSRAKMEEDMRLLNARLAGSREDQEQAMQDVARLEAELAELKARPVEVAVETVVDQEAIDKARAEAVAEMQAKLDKAKEAAARARDKQKQAEASVEILKRSLEEREKVDKKAAIAGDKELVQFEVLFNQGQELAHKMQGYLLKARGRADQTAAQGMEKAIRALADLMGRCAE
ncbi:DUF3102 domain-containing protein [Pseudoflavonifractor phocaeensis]|uniref:DUF3102 domain-containing protein n=1 Tax=Pseudoflavonifractor phocaeensis TaxID=1870988 RepID=UPI001958A9B5|nr:DUF3102 domain-containing protein [Pseudoflavonifractor phocaeensis]MBM6926942.1 DUF3102 domain-containing protein [Pseudoflavonifractor phocaeensis]